MQHPGSKLCGHAVVAMALGIHLDVAITLIGHQRTTKTRELVKALGNLVCSPHVEPRLTQIWGRHLWDLPEVSVLRVRWHQGTDRGHFVLRDGPYIHDPLEAGPHPIASWEEKIEPHGKVTSFLPLTIGSPLPEVGDEYIHPLHGRQIIERVNHDPSGIVSIFSYSVEKAADGRPLVSVVSSIKKGQGEVYKPIKSRYSVLSED